MIVGKMMNGENAKLTIRQDDAIRGSLYGPAYLLWYMDGRAIREMESGNLSPQTFKLT